MLGPPAGDWSALARAKLSAVVGGSKADALMRRMLKEMALDALSSADELYLFGQRLTAIGGFEGAVGALISVQAVMYGATTSAA